MLKEHSSGDELPRCAFSELGSVFILGGTNDSVDILALSNMEFDKKSTHDFVDKLKQQLGFALDLLFGNRVSSYERTSTSAGKRCTPWRVAW